MSVPRPPPIFMCLYDKRQSLTMADISASRDAHCVTVAPSMVEELGPNRF